MTDTQMMEWAYGIIHTYTFEISDTQFSMSRVLFIICASMRYIYEGFAAINLSFLSSISREKESTHKNR